MVYMQKSCIIDNFRTTRCSDRNLNIILLLYVKFTILMTDFWDLKSLFYRANPGQMA